MIARLEEYRHLTELVRHQLLAFPDHESHLARRFERADKPSLEFDDLIAEKILRIAGADIGEICNDYRWLCGKLLDEELEFRRTGRYRLSTFEQALTEVYNDREYMTRYMNGLLVSHVWWQNHSAGLKFYRDRFLAHHASGYSHLEVGPGHGLFLYLAASSPKCKRAIGWDVSEASLAGTRLALNALGAGNNIELNKVDLFAAPSGTFQSISISEVLEHLEDPKRALRILNTLLEPNGRIFIKTPVNTPMPDHIFLFSAPEEVVALVEDAGFRVVETMFAPAIGVSLERARKLKLGISTAVIATKS